MKNKKIVRVPISFELLKQLMYNNYKSGGIIKTIDGIPPDAIFAGSSTDPSSWTGYLFFTHESFDEVPEAGVIPEISPTHKIDYEPINLLEEFILILRDREYNDSVFRMRGGIYDTYFKETVNAAYEYLHGHKLYPNDEEE